MAGIGIVVFIFGGALRGLGTFNGEHYSFIYYGPYRFSCVIGLIISKQKLSKTRKIGMASIAQCLTGWRPYALTIVLFLLANFIFCCFC